MKYSKYDTNFAVTQRSVQLKLTCNHGNRELSHFKHTYSVFTSNNRVANYLIGKTTTKMSLHPPTFPCPSSHAINKRAACENHSWRNEISTNWPPKVAVKFTYTKNRLVPLRRAIAISSSRDSGGNVKEWHLPAVAEYTMMNLARFKEVIDGIHSRS